MSQLALEIKTCSRCKKSKPLSNFAKGGNSRGLHGWCRECIAVNQRERRVRLRPISVLLFWLTKPANTKYCIKCKQFKHYNEFSKSSKRRGGLEVYCRLCNSQRKYTNKRPLIELFRFCSLCHIIKPITEFGKIDHPKYPDGLAHHCLLCGRAKCKTRYYSDIKKARKSSKDSNRKTRAKRQHRVNVLGLCYLCGTRKHDEGVRYCSVCRQKKAERWLQTKTKAMQMVSGLTVPQCLKCPITDIRILTINHKNGRGKEEQRYRGGERLYSAIVRGKRKIDDLDVRCFNCNYLYEYERGRLTTVIA